MILDRIIDSIKEAKKIAILPHVSIDGDSYGSSIALAMAIKKLGKEVFVVMEEESPWLYSFLPGNEFLLDYSKVSESVDLAIAIDVGDIGRLGNKIEVFQGSKLTANVDHHGTNTEFAFYNHVDANASAAGEIVYKMIKLMDIDIDTDIAKCLYVAIASDTGGFRYSNTTATTHLIISDLIKNGVVVSDISQKIFETSTLEKVKVTGLAINSLELYFYGRMGLITITEDDMIKAGAKDEDCDGIVNVARNIVGVEVSVLIRKRANGDLRVNLRSKNYVDVAKIASMYTGGGHKRAAGFTTDKSLEIIKNQLIKDIEDVLIQ